MAWLGSWPQCLPPVHCTSFALTFRWCACKHNMPRVHHVWVCQHQAKVSRLVLQAEPGEPNAAVAMELGMRPEALDEQQIELLIHDQVHQKLQVILEGEMALALQDFVDKVSALDAQLSI